MRLSNLISYSFTLASRRHLLNLKRVRCTFTYINFHPSFIETLRQQKLSQKLQPQTPELDLAANWVTAKPARHERAMLASTLANADEHTRVYALCLPFPPCTDGMTRVWSHTESRQTAVSLARHAQTALSATSTTVTMTLWRGLRWP